MTAPPTPPKEAQATITLEDFYTADQPAQRSMIRSALSELERLGHIAQVPTCVVRVPIHWAALFHPDNFEPTYRKSESVRGVAK